jgi:hypothetical protein
MQSVDQERADYTDYDSVRRELRRRPWTLAQVAVLILIVVLCLPLAFLALFAAALVLSGGMQH